MAWILGRLLNIFSPSPHLPSEHTDAGNYRPSASSSTPSAIAVRRERRPGDRITVRELLYHWPYIMLLLLNALIVLWAVAAATPLLKRSNNDTSSIYNTRFENVTWDQSSWTISTTKLDQGRYQSRLSIANGYLGINVAAVCPTKPRVRPAD